MASIRIGFIGCGNMSTILQVCTTMTDAIELTAVCDIDEAKACRNAGKFAARHYLDFKQMLAEEKLDVVAVVGHPVSMQRDISIEVLKAGFDLFTEKPVGGCAADALAVRDAARAAGRLVMVGTMWRHMLVHRKVKAVIDDETFGPITGYRICYVAPSPVGPGQWDSPQRALLLDQGVHPLDCSIFLCGAVRAVAAACNEGGDGVISLNVNLHFDSGLVGQYYLGNASPVLHSHISVQGKGRRFVEAEDFRKMRLFSMPPWTEHGGYTDQPAQTWNPADVLVGYIRPGYLEELNHLADCIANRRPPAASIDDAVMGMRAVDAIVESLPDGKLIELPGE